MNALRLLLTVTTIVVAADTHTWYLARMDDETCIALGYVTTNLQRNKTGDGTFKTPEQFILSLELRYGFSAMRHDLSKENLYSTDQKSHMQSYDIGPHDERVNLVFFDDEPACRSVMNVSNEGGK